MSEENLIELDDIKIESKGKSNKVDENEKNIADTFCQSFLDLYRINSEKTSKYILSLNKIIKHVENFKKDNFVIILFNDVKLVEYVNTLLKYDEIEFDIIKIKVSKFEIFGEYYYFYGTFDEFSKFNELNRNYNKNKNKFKKSKTIIDINNLRNADLIIKKDIFDFTKYKFHINNFNYAFGFDN